MYNEKLFLLKSITFIQGVSTCDVCNDSTVQTIIITETIQYFTNSTSNLIGRILFKKI